MDPLRDWHEYVDRLSRPARRLADEEPETARWRPWMEPAAPEEEVEAIEPHQLPDLLPALGLGGLHGARRTAVPEYEDPTLNDSLRPIPSFGVPRLSAPGFEVTAPTLGAPPPVEAVPEPEAHEETAQEEEAAVSAPVVTPGKRKELLELIRAESAPPAGGKARSREPREDLVQRLLDPTLTLEETAVFLGVCPTTVRRYTNRGLLKHFRTQGNQRRFRLSDVVEFLESRSTEIEADALADREAGRR